MKFLKFTYEILLFCILTIYAVVVFADPTEHPYITERVIRKMNLYLNCFFAIEYVIRFWKSKEKKKFVIRNWFDLIALIPVDSYFLLAKFMRIIRIARIVKSSPFLRGILSLKEMRWIFIICLTVIMWSSGVIYFLENGINHQIKTYGDALWWSVITITTVGYGDIAPVTTGGRIIAVILMFSGIGLLGTFTAELASHWRQYFHRIKQLKNKKSENIVKEEIKESVIKWIEDIEKLSDDEYKTLLQTLILLRTTGDNKEKENKE